MAALHNPEVAWSRAVAPQVNRAEVERRIGPTSEPLEVLTGGFASVNVRVGRELVLRIKGDPVTVVKEATLLSRPWRSFRTPHVLATGEDFLVLEYLPLSPLSDSPAVGEAVGRALAEIHSIRYPAMGLLDGDLSIATPIPDEGDGGTGYVLAMLAEAEPFLTPELVASVRAFVAARVDEAAASFHGPVLTHSDFKVSNLHLLPDGGLAVLDWEFAWAGLHLLDVGQLLRWKPPTSFVDAFATSYRESGGILVEGWRRSSELIDVGSLCGVFAHNPIMRTSPEIPVRIAEIVSSR